MDTRRSVFSLICILLIISGAVMVFIGGSNLLKYMDEESTIEVEALIVSYSYYEDPDGDTISNYYATNIKYIIDGKEYINTIKLGELPEEDTISIRVAKDNYSTIVDQGYMGTYLILLVGGALSLFSVIWSKRQFSR